MRNVVVTNMDGVVIWTVYDGPSDFPGEYVARKFLITPEQWGPTYELIRSKSLKDVRSTLRQLYPNLVRLERQKDDEPHIVEVWL